MRRLRTWLPLVMALLVAHLAAGCGVLDSDSDSDSETGGGADDGGGSAWQERAAAIEGVETFDEEQLAPSHVAGSINYDVLPPVGGSHNERWQDCTGVVYDDQIASEHAVHSMEHGAVWITYHPSLPADHVAALAERVAGVDKMFMSPFPDLDAPISLQAWGFQLKLDNAGDSRIDEFIRTLRDVAGPEAGVAICGGPSAVTTTGTTPVA
jgi:hypothetical protein